MTNNFVREQGGGGEERSNPLSLLRRLLNERRTWGCLFVLVYAFLLSSSWNLLRSILTWYNSNISSNVASDIGWPMIYASVLLGAVFGILSMATTLVVAIPATFLRWITVLVLLTFCGKLRQSRVLEGRKITDDIAGFLLREGNIAAAICAVLGYFVLVKKAREED